MQCSAVQFTIMFKSIHLSNSFVISSGTVTLDLHRSQVLLLHYRKTGEFLLPKGRKDVGERLEDAAVRETREESGYAVKLMDADVGSLATRGSASLYKVSCDGKDRDSVNSSSSDIEIHGFLATEPVAVTQRMIKNTLKIIFWYAACADSESEKCEQPTKDRDEFESVWVDWDSVEENLTFEHDKNVAAYVIEGVKSRRI